MVNFFYLDKDPIKCAKYYCNKHVLKIPIEIAQILSKIHHELETGIDYCKVYKNSLVVKNTLGPYCWIKQSYDNYIWTSKLGLALINEYKLRYNKDATDDKKYELINSTYQNKSTQNRQYYANKANFRKENDFVGKFSNRSRFYNIFKVYNRNKQIIELDKAKIKDIQDKSEKSQLDLKAIKDEIYRNFEINFPTASYKIKNFIMIIMDYVGVDINDNDSINIKLACITEIYDKYKNDLICNQTDCLEKATYENDDKTNKRCIEHKTNVMKPIKKELGDGDILFTDITQIYEECMTNKLISPQPAPVVKKTVVANTAAATKSVSAVIKADPIKNANLNPNTITKKKTNLKLNINKTKKTNYCYQ